MYTFIFTSIGIIFGYLFKTRNKSSLTSAKNNNLPSIPKFIGRKSLAIDFSNLFHSHTSSSPNHTVSSSLKIAIPVATVKNEIASKIGIYYTDEDLSSSSPELIKTNQKLVLIPFNSTEMSILPPFSSFPQRFKDLYLCFEDDVRKVEHKIDTSSLPLGVGWWPTEIEKLVQKV